MTVSEITKSSNSSQITIYFEYGHEKHGISTRRAVCDDGSDKNPEFQKAQMSEGEFKHWRKFGTEGGLDLLPPEEQSKQSQIEDSVTPPEQREIIVRQLSRAKQVVFHGPPGTGKTYTARKFARWWLNQQDGYTPTEAQLQTVTFHPSFSYEDFIEGLTAEEKNGEVVYEIKDGRFKRISQQAKQAYESAKDSDEADEAPRYILIIDEINRGNLAQIFGETMTLLESDKRYDQENEVKISLAHSGESFVVPPNLYIIGTMNTADQSISLVDTALRRRFRFVDFPPELDVVFEQYESTDAGMGAEDLLTTAGGVVSDRNLLLAASVSAVDELNRRILDTAHLGRGKQIGHTYLLKHGSKSAVVDAWRFDILPQLEEYYFEQFDRLQKNLLGETGKKLFNWETERIQEFTAEELYKALCMLSGIENPVELSGQDAISD